MDEQTNPPEEGSRGFRVPQPVLFPQAAAYVVFFLLLYSARNLWQPLLPQSRVFHFLVLTALPLAAALAVRYLRVRVTATRRGGKAE